MGKRRFFGIAVLFLIGIAGGAIPAFAGMTTFPALSRVRAGGYPARSQQQTRRKLPYLSISRNQNVRRRSPAWTLAVSTCVPEITPW